MSIENELARIATALERLAGNKDIGFAGLQPLPQGDLAPPKVGRPKKATSAPESPVPAASTATAVKEIPVEPPAEIGTAKSASPSEKPPSVEDVRAVLIAVQSKISKKRAMELLNKWTSGAGVLSKLKEEDRAGVIAEGQALVS